MLLASAGQTDHGLQLEDRSRVIAQLSFPLNQDGRSSFASDLRLGRQSRGRSLFSQVPNSMQSRDEGVDLETPGGQSVLFPKLKTYRISA
jgi:hypothetical protein